MQQTEKTTEGFNNPNQKTQKHQGFKQANSSQSFDIMAKLIIIGDSSVGKTNILTRFCYNMFKQNHVATIGVDFNVKLMQIEDTLIKMQIWDTAGQQRFRTITQTYYKGAAGIILVYSVDSKQSFDNIRKWVQQVNQKIPLSVPKILVANKIDLFDEQTYQENEINRHNFHISADNRQTSEEGDEQFQYQYKKHHSFLAQQFAQHQRQVSKEEGIQLAKQLNLQYLEVSAKQNTQVYQIFYQLGKQIKNSVQQLDPFDHSKKYRPIMVGQKFGYGSDGYGTCSIVKLSQNDEKDKNCAC